MRVSVIIPIYRRQEMGLRAIRSVLEQAVGDMEIIVVDDGSPEAFVLPPDLAEDARIRLIRHPVNRGASAARNTAIAAAKGQWLAFLDSDDIWLAGKLAGQLALADAHDEPLTAYATGFVYHNAATGRLDGMMPIECDDVADFASATWFAPGSTALIRREAFAIVGAYDESLRRLEDLDWFLRFALAGGRLRVLMELGALIKSSGKPGLATLRETTAAMRRKWLEPDSSHSLAPGRARRLLAYLDVECASSAWYEGKPMTALAYLIRSFLRIPRRQVHLRRFWRMVPVDPAFLKA